MPGFVILRLACASRRSWLQADVYSRDEFVQARPMTHDLMKATLEALGYKVMSQGCK